MRENRESQQNQIGQPTKNVSPTSIKIVQNQIKELAKIQTFHAVFFGKFSSNR